MVWIAVFGNPSISSKCGCQTRDVVTQLRQCGRKESMSQVLHKYPERWTDVGKNSPDGVKNVLGVFVKT